MDLREENIFNTERSPHDDCFNYDTIDHLNRQYKPLYPREKESKSILEGIEEAKQELEGVDIQILDLFAQVNRSCRG